MTEHLQPGSDFGVYRISRMLGRGGMAEVYLAERQDDPEPIALKVIASHFTSDPGFRRRFERESRLARRVEHPHVVAVRDSGEHDGVLFLATDYIPGLDLAAVLAASGPLHPADAMSIVAQIADALSAAAAIGMIHRDVKPGNIFVREREGAPWALLGDFGLSKEVTSTSGLTATGQWVGTVDYASPEQLQAADVDHRTDIYSLGAVLHRCLTNQVPYPRERDVAKVIAQIAAPPPQPSRVDPALPARFDPIVARAMAKDPAERYASGSELVAALAEAAAGLDPAPAWSAAAELGSAPGAGSRGIAGEDPASPDAPTVT